MMDKPKEASIFDKRLEQMTTEHASIMESVRNLGTKFQSPRLVGQGMHEFYNYRSYLVDIKKTYRKILTAYDTQRRGLHKDMVESLKQGTRVGSYKGQISTLPKNDKEREIYWSEGMSDIDYEISMVNNHLEFIIDQINSIDKMTFGFETIIKFYEKWS